MRAPARRQPKIRRNIPNPMNSIFYIIGVIVVVVVILKVLGVY